ncbi:MAG: desulfoferrodoxin family protein [Blautia sp.]|nr:desulfoferrodoxin family protein [Blautia sp.]
MALKFLLCLDMLMNPLFHTDFSISDSLKSVRKSVLIYETIILGTSITELLTGDLRENENMSGNMKRMHFFVCPICGNIIASVGQGVFSCCGITLYGAEGEKCDEDHLLCVETVDNEYHVTLSHPMDKKHYISFIAYVTSDSYEIVKLYPEQDISVRFRKKGHGMMVVYCNRHGMFQKPV